MRVLHDASSKRRASCWLFAPSFLLKLLEDFVFYFAMALYSYSHNSVGELFMLGSAHGVESALGEELDHIPSLRHGLPSVPIDYIGSLR